MIVFLFKAEQLSLELVPETWQGLPDVVGQLLVQLLLQIRGATSETYFCKYTNVFKSNFEA